MMIPSSIKIGKTRYPVEQPITLKNAVHAGNVTYGQSIRVAYRIRMSSGRLQSRTEHQRNETFWHEVTHAILKDMDHKLESNEKFVTDFSRRLNDAIRSAKF
jgi:hypothetical protein